MLSPLRLALIALLAAAGAAAAQQPAPPDPSPLSVSLGALGTGKLWTAGTVGTIGFFHSDLARVVSASPQAVRLAHVFTRDRTIGRSLLLIGGGLVVGGLAAYATRGGGIGLGGRELGAMALGNVALLYGAHEMTLSRRALDESVAEYNRER